MILTSAASTNWYLRCIDRGHYSCADSHLDEQSFRQKHKAIAFRYPCTFDGRISNQGHRHARNKLRECTLTHVPKCDPQGIVRTAVLSLIFTHWLICVRY
jgi:hypothetical protein